MDIKIMISLLTKFGAVAVLMLALGSGMGGGGALAQSSQKAAPNRAVDDKADADVDEVRGSIGDERKFVEIKLTKKNLASFIEAQKKIITLLDSIPANGAAEATMKRKITAISKAAGFATLDDLDDVGRTIGNVMSSIDPDTKEFVEPKELIRREIEQVKISDFIPDEDRPKILAELKDVLARMQPMKYLDNVAMVKANFVQLEIVMQPVE